MEHVKVLAGSGNGGVAARFGYIEGLRNETFQESRSVHMNRIIAAAIALGSVLGIGITLLAQQSPQPPATQPKPMMPLFNGKDLAGWKAPENNIWWKVENGVLVGENDPANRGSQLYTEKEYKDVEFETEFRFKGETDSGIYLRKPLTQVQIGTSRSLKVDKTASLYQEGRGGGYVGNANGVDKLLKEGEWNKMRFIAKGDKLTVWLNGQQVLETSLAKYPDAAPLGVQIHQGLKMKIEYRNMNARELN